VNIEAYNSSDVIGLKIMQYISNVGNVHHLEDLKLNLKGSYFFPGITILLYLLKCYLDLNK